MNRCKNCRHWLGLCPHNRPLGEYCDDCGPDTDPFVKAEHIRRGRCRRGDALRGEPRDEATLMWGQDGSDYRAHVHTLPDFGCVMWEGKP